MSAEDKTELPQAMIEAAARALIHSTPLRGQDVHESARRVLTAALAVCDVREHQRIGGYWFDYRDDREPGDVTHRRLVITTPATEVTDEEGGSDD